MTDPNDDTDTDTVDLATATIEEIHRVLDESEGPEGCLECNHDDVAAYLKRFRISEHDFTKVPEPRHAWGDITRCGRCGTCWLHGKDD